MKIELDLNAEQLAQLDTSLADLIKCLTDEQKQELIKPILENKLEQLIWTNISGYYSSSKSLTDFGKHFVDSLKEGVTSQVVDILTDNEEYKKIVKQCIDYSKQATEEVFAKKLSEHLINGIFENKESLKQNLSYSILNMLRPHN